MTSLALAAGYSTSCGSEPAFTYSINNANRVSSGGFQYDASGNLTNGTRYGYNAESQLTTLPNANETYVYDGDGNRIEKLVNGSVAKIYWYGSGSMVLEETDGSGSVTNGNFSQYIFFGSARIARRDSSGNVFYYVDDHLGSARVIVQAGQTSPCYDADFYPFGGEIAHANTCPQNYKFTGKERDPETNLDDFGARYYSSGSQIAFAPFGRFMSPDWSHTRWPIPHADLRNPQSMNLYAYVGNNPVTAVDSDGHGPSPFDIFISWLKRFWNSKVEGPVQTTRSEWRTFLWTDDPLLKGEMARRLLGIKPVPVPTLGAQNTVGPPLVVPSLPNNVLQILGFIDAFGANPPGYHSDDFQNDGRKGSEVLPRTDAQGNPIKYEEWDVHPETPGTRRGEERIVTGSDGSAYYTNDHYKTFKKIR